jgi:site-specific recombinase XerD/ribosomal protein L40E
VFLPFKLPKTIKNMTTDEPIHDYEQRLIRARRSIKLLPHGETALHFIDHLNALGLSIARITKYAIQLPVLLRMINDDLKSITRHDVETVVAAINNSNQKAWTKHDKKLLLRKLVQYAKMGSCTKGTALPSEVSWISLAVKDKDSRVTPESLLTPEDFTAIVKATTNKRDRAMVYVLFEAALRPGELLTMQIGSVVFKEEYCLIAAKGKTGIKRIPLVLSCKHLLDWLEDHLNRCEPEAPLWCALDNNHQGKRLSYRHFRMIIKRLAKKADIKKDIWPYLYRHTSLTAMAKVFTEARLEQFAGWTYGSKMTSRYVHFSARDLEDAILELHGLKTTTNNTNLAKLIQCPRCNTQNPFGTIRCTKCGIILDKETALKFEEKQSQTDANLQEKNVELQKRLEKLEGTISALLITTSNKF